MSFSALVKNELCRHSYTDRPAVVAEMAAIVRLTGHVELSDEEMILGMTTENAPFARHIYQTFKGLYGFAPTTILRKSRRLKGHSTWKLSVRLPSRERWMAEELGIFVHTREGKTSVEYLSYLEYMLPDERLRKAFLRGAFLSGGSMTDPEKGYHLEITCHHASLAYELADIFTGFSLKGRIVQRKNLHVLYLKDGEDIVDFLNIIGAHTALMELENVRIVKEMRNNVNRVVNCETANLEKTVNASVRQSENIRFLLGHKLPEELPGNLRDIAELRLAYPDASLIELGEMMEPPLGKSGVNHRLRKLDEMAEKLRSELPGK